MQFKNKNHFFINLNRFKKWMKLKNYFAKSGLKCQTPLPFVGNFLSAAVLKGFREYDMDSIGKYGKTFGFFELNKPVVVTTDLNFIKLAMIKDFAHFTNRIDPDV